MNNTAKTVTFVVAIVVLATVVILGYTLYKNQQNQTARTTYTSTITPKPTEQPVLTNGISESDSDKAIEGELNATILEDIEADFNALEQETSSL